MGARRGVGATVAATLIFSSLLLSNLLILSSSEDRSRLAAASAREHEVGDLYLIEEGVAAFGALSHAQKVLSSRAWPCSQPLASVAGALDGWAETAAEENVSVSARETPSGDTAAPDNLSIMAPFDGLVPGTLGLEVVMTGSSPPVGGVQFSRSEVHRLHLPVRLSLLDSLCLASAAALSSALSSASSCSATALNSTISAVAGPFESEGESEGIGVSARAQVRSTDPCAYSYAVTCSEAVVPGPAGAFTFVLEEEGSATPPPASAASQP